MTTEETVKVLESYTLGNALLESDLDSDDLFKLTICDEDNAIMIGLEEIENVCKLLEFVLNRKVEK